MSRLGDLERWFAYRTYDKYHVIPVYGAGYYYSDKDEQMLRAMFGLLVDFVEVELAGMHWACGDQNTAWNRFIQSLTPWVDRSSREDGMKHLDWAITLVHDSSCGSEEGDPHFGQPTPQATAAMEQKALYLWWMDERPLRPEPAEASGSLALYDDSWWDKTDKNGYLTALSEERRAAYKRLHEIKERYEDEDQAMLHRLIEIRRSLWT